MDAAPTASPNLREKRKLQTQLDITKTALALFAEHGFENVSVELICEHAGVSRATFFNYFPQKDMVLAGIGLSRIETMRKFLAEQLTHTRKVKMRDVITIFEAFSQENENLGRQGKGLLLQVLLRPASHAGIVELRKQFIATLTEVLSQMRSNGSLSGEPVVVADTIFALYIGTTIEWLMDTSLSKGWLTVTLTKRLQMATGGFDPGRKR